MKNYRKFNHVEPCEISGKKIRDAKYEIRIKNNHSCFISRISYLNPLGFLAKLGMTVQILWNLLLIKN